MAQKTAATGGSWNGGRLRACSGFWYGVDAMSTDYIETHHDLWRAVVAFYRDEIERRYQLENVRRFEEFAEVTDGQAVALREFFLEHIYPPIQGREKLDTALERLRDVLRSPKRMAPFMKVGLSSMWKLGASLPGAVKAGLRVLDTYHEARNLENTMVRTAVEQGLRPEDAADRGKMIGIIVDVPESDVMRLVEDIMALFHVLSNTKMLDTAVDFLGTCREIMKGKPDLYDETDVAGIGLGRAVVEGGLALFRRIDPEVFPVMISGIERVELDWYERAVAEARG